MKIGGAQLREMIIAGATLLEKNKATIDALNVFPVPDGDTGTNMSMTMQSAVHEIRALPETATATQVADALSMGALKGARGNSGVILSQLFRGFSRAFKGAEFIDAELLSAALTKGKQMGGLSGEPGESPLGCHHYRRVQCAQERSQAPRPRETPDAHSSAVASSI